MKTKTSLITICIGAALFSLNCSSPTQTTGNGSGSGNAVVGKLYSPGGNAPAAGIRVVIRPQKSLADTSGTGLGKRMADTASAVTDSAGRFAFDSTLDTGTYVIEAASGNNAVLIDSVKVKTKTATDTLPSDTLKPAGAIKGVIKLSEGGDPRKVFILAFGIDRFARVNADGSFKFSNLAETAYDLRIISSLDNYGVLDTPNVAVTAAETTDVKTIDLPFTGIPTPKNVLISYDTLKQIVALSWSKSDSALVKGFNVYRRNVDSNSVLKQINTSPVTDTVYRDSTGIQDFTYEYRVAAVNKNVTEGTKSAAVSVKVVGAFVLIDSIGSKGAANNQLFMPRYANSAGSFYLVCDLVSPYPSAASAKLFDRNGSLIRTFTIRKNSNAEYLYQLNSAIDKQNHIYVVFKDSTFEYDTSGIILSVFPLAFPDLETPISFVQAKDSIRIYYFDRANQKVIARNLKDSVILSFNISIPSYAVDNIAVDSSGNLFITNTVSMQISKYDPVGNLVASLGSKGNGFGKFGSIKGIVADNAGRLFVNDEENSNVQIFSKDGICIGHFSTYFNTQKWQGTVNDNSEPINFFLNSDGTLCILEGNVFNKIHIFKISNSITLP